MFIALESSEGAGKGTLSGIACRAMELSGTPFVHTRQPGGTPAAEKIREMFLDKNHHFTLKEEIMMLAVARKRLWDEVIEPALKEGKVVLCERWHATTVAYQGHARNMGGAFNREAIVSFIGETFRGLGLVNRRPDLSIFLHVDTEVGLERAKVRGELDRLESMGVDFLDVANKALHQLHVDKPRWLMEDSAIINANNQLPTVTIEFLATLVVNGLISEEAGKQVYRETFL